MCCSTHLFCLSIRTTRRPPMACRQDDLQCTVSNGDCTIFDCAAVAGSAVCACTCTCTYSTSTYTAGSLFISFKYRPAASACCTTLAIFRYSVLFRPLRYIRASPASLPFQQIRNSEVGCQQCQCTVQRCLLQCCQVLPLAISVSSVSTNCLVNLPVPVDMLLPLCSLCLYRCWSEAVCIYVLNDDIMRSCCMHVKCRIARFRGVLALADV